MKKEKSMASANAAAGGGDPSKLEFMLSCNSIKYHVCVNADEGEFEISELRELIQAVLTDIGEDARSVKTLDLSFAKKSGKITWLNEHTSPVDARVKATALTALFQRPIATIQLSPCRVEVFSSWTHGIPADRKVAIRDQVLREFDSIRNYQKALIGAWEECQAQGKHLYEFQELGSIAYLGLCARTIQISQKYFFSPKALGTGDSADLEPCYIPCLANLAYYLGVSRWHVQNNPRGQQRPEYLDRNHLSCLLACISSGPDKAPFISAAAQARLVVVGGNVLIPVQGHECVIELDHIASRHMMAYFNYAEPASMNAAFTTFWPISWNLNDMRNCLETALSTLLLPKGSGSKFKPHAEPGPNTIEVNIPGHGLINCTIVLGDFQQEPLRVTTFYPNTGPHLIGAMRKETSAILGGYMRVSQIKGRPVFD
jgi:hypothetical protein